MWRLKLLLTICSSKILCLTNENEAGSNDVRQQVASDRFVVFTVIFAKESNERVKFVLAQTLYGQEIIHFIVSAQRIRTKAQCVSACVLVPGRLLEQTPNRPMQRTELLQIYQQWWEGQRQTPCSLTADEQALLIKPWRTGSITYN